MPGTVNLNKSPWLGIIGPRVWEKPLVMLSKWLLNVYDIVLLSISVTEASCITLCSSYCRLTSDQRLKNKSP